MTGSSGSLEERIAKLEHSEAIRTLLNDYGRTLDGRDSLAYANLFAADGEWIAGEYSARTPEGIRAMVERVFAALPADGSAHFFSNVTVALDGERAVSTSRFMLVSPVRGGASVVKMSGRYEDTLIVENGRWRFLRRVLHQDAAADAR